MAFRLALTALFVAALCSSSMGSSVYRLQRAAKPAAKAAANAAASPNANPSANAAASPSANAAASPNANAAASPNANAAASPNANAAAIPSANVDSNVAANSAASAAQNQAAAIQQQQQQFVQQQQYRQIKYIQQQQPPQGRAVFYQQQPYVEVSRFAPGQPAPPAYQAIQVAQPAPVQAIAAKSAIPAGAAPSVPDQQAQVVGQSYDFNPVDNSFSYGFQTNNGISQQAKGYTNQNGNFVQEGSYTLYTPEGVPVVISYIADENGFQAFGDAIPTPDPVIARAIAYQRSLPVSAEAENNKV